MKTRDISVGLALTLVGYAAAVSAAEPSATLRQMKGRVFVSQAATMGPARDGMPLYAGSRVVAVVGGSAQVVYAGGCVVDLPEGSMLAIGEADQCSAGQALVRTTEGFESKAIGQTTPSAVQMFLMSLREHVKDKLTAHTTKDDIAERFKALRPVDRVSLLRDTVTTMEEQAALFQAMSVRSVNEAEAFIDALPAAQGNKLAAAGAAGEPPPVAYVFGAAPPAAAFTAGQVGLAVGAAALGVGIIVGAGPGGTGVGSSIVPGVIPGNRPTSP